MVLVSLQGTLAVHIHPSLDTLSSFVFYGRVMQSTFHLLGHSALFIYMRSSFFFFIYFFSFFYFFYFYNIVAVEYFSILSLVSNIFAISLD